MRKTKKNIINASILMCMFMFVACFTGASITLASANNYDDNTYVESIEFTSYTTVMALGEDCKFAAEAILNDGTTSDDVLLTSSNEDILYFEDGIVYAIDLGVAKIIAEYERVTASIDVTVLEEVIHVEGVEVDPNEVLLYPRETAQLTALILPEDATDPQVIWKSSDTNIATVDENGLVTAVAAGTATITATSNDGYNGNPSATCEVTVLDFEEGAYLTPDGLTLKIGETGNFTVELPDGAKAAHYAWTSYTSKVATPDANSNEVGRVTAWGFGTAIISVVVTDTNGMKYEARGTVLVTADYFYLTGVRGNWNTYDSAEDAEKAGMLLTPVEGKANVYSITREFWAYDGFQILNSDINPNWTTKLIPYWIYSAKGSDDQYVANTNEMFQVNAYGVYTVTLDLSDGLVKVFINMKDVYITIINPSIQDGSNAVLQKVGDTSVILVELQPTNAIVEKSEIKVDLSGAGASYASVAEISDVVYNENEDGKATLTFTITVKLDKALPEDVASDVFELFVNIAINEAYNSIELAVASENAVAPTTIAFEQTQYTINVNNGGKAWETKVLAKVDADATIKGVEYFSDDISVDSATGVVSASAFGVYHVTARAIGNPNLTATTEVVVYSSAFYLIGVLQGETVNDWTAILSDATTDLADTPFANWGLEPVDGSLTKYSGTFNFNEDDMFSIVFLGMTGNWYGAIRATELNWANSSRDYFYEKYNNIQIRVTGLYTVTLDISGATPTFTVVYNGFTEVTAYDLYLYLMRAGSSWLYPESRLENVLAYGGEIKVDGKTSNQTLSFTFDFATMKEWPVFQFMTSAGGVATGFADAYWYGSGVGDVKISGDALDASSANGYFDHIGCKFWFVGDLATANLNVAFNVTFDANGSIIAIELNFVK